jgi:hypothetical protein
LPALSPNSRAWTRPRRYGSYAAKRVCRSRRGGLVVGSVVALIVVGCSALAGASFAQPCRPSPRKSRPGV